MTPPFNGNQAGHRPTSGPPEGTWRRACYGLRWWTERHEPKGWRCMRCHPPDHLAPDQMEVVGYRAQGELQSMTRNPRQIAYERELDEWRRLVGTMLLSFGDIEFITVKCLAHLGDSKAIDKLSRLKFGERTDRLMKVIKKRYGASPAADEFVQKLAEAKVLAKVRNDIAHNPLHMQFYADKSTGDTLTELAIVAIRSGEPINRDFLKEQAAKAGDLASELFLAFGRLQSDTNARETTA